MKNTTQGRKLCVVFLCKDKHLWEEKSREKIEIKHLCIFCTKINFLVEICKSG